MPLPVGEIENIAFGLRGLSRSPRERRVRDLIDLVGLNGTAKRYPHVLSGGQQQRVALVRAMAPRPEVLLLDEPFSSLDVELREQIAKEVSIILKQEGITAILVSHNQLETFAMADQIEVINQGRLLQWDTAYNLYHRPRCRYVADFIGEGVFLEDTVAGADEVMTELGSLRGRMTVTLPAGVSRTAFGLAPVNLGGLLMGLAMVRDQGQVDGHALGPLAQAFGELSREQPIHSLFQRYRVGTQRHKRVAHRLVTGGIPQLVTGSKHRAEVAGRIKQHLQQDLHRALGAMILPLQVKL
jgi:energy-coupling factor transporter ATP-binding protein EcfA2